MRGGRTGRVLGRAAERAPGHQPLRIIDQAALFVAPKTNYFLCSDLDEIAAGGGGAGALAPLIVGPGDEPAVEFTHDQIDSARIVFPFPANRAQRKVALVVEDETTHVVRVEGPPGTGKSLTIANLACHLAASGKTVLITSQKDKALEVVDETLRKLNLAELPMTLLRRDKESKRELLNRLERVEKRRPTDEVNAHYETLATTLEEASGEQIADAERYAAAIIRSRRSSWPTADRARPRDCVESRPRRQVVSALRRAKRRPLRRRTGGTAGVFSPRHAPGPRARASSRSGSSARSPGPTGGAQGGQGPPGDIEAEPDLAQELLPVSTR